MYVCMYVQVYTYVYGCSLTIVMHVRMGSWVCVHIGAEIYLQRYVECRLDHMYFVWEPLIPQPARISEDGLIKVEVRIKRASVLLSHLLGSFEDLQSDNIFYVSSMGGRKSGNRNFYPCIHTREFAGLKGYRGDGTKEWRPGTLILFTQPLCSGRK